MSKRASFFSQHPELVERESKVAIVRASRIGDFICATPAFRALRATLPRADFSLVGLPFVQPLVERNTALDHFIPFPGFPGMAEQFFASRATTEFFRRMQNENFDLVIQMHGSGANSNTFCLLLGGRFTVGFSRNAERSGLLSEVLPYADRDHESKRCLDLIRYLGGPDEVEVADRIQSSVRGPVVNLAGPLSLPVMGAVIERLKLLVTNDSGPAHIAYALGVPTVTIFGGTEAWKWAPLHAGPFQSVWMPIDCRPCSHCTRDFDCLRSIRPESVLAVARDLFAEPKKREEDLA